MKRSNLWMVGVLALTLATAPAAFAQEANLSTTTTVDDQTVSGTIVSTTGDQIVITTDAGQRMTFNRDVSFTMPSGLAVGNRVSVTYRGIDANDYTVNRIVMADNTVTGTTTTTDNTTSTTTSTYGTTNTYDTDLPGTASPMPLIGLLGALGLAAGTAIRALKRR